MDLDRVLHASPVSYASADDWWRDLPEGDPIDVAIFGGARADRVAWAFATGYASALEAITGVRAKQCVAATEEGGAHPRAIQTKLENGRLVGRKKYVTLGAHADVMLVVAKTGEREGRPVLKVARVPRANASIVHTFSAPVVPEITHSEVTFDCEASDLLPGDGYDDFLKPFRSFEDLYVHAALCAHLANVAMRSGWKRPTIARLTSLLACARELARGDLKKRHIPLAGLLFDFESLLPLLEFDRCPPDVKERWERDRALMNIAGKARAQRFERAWER